MPVAFFTRTQTGALVCRLNNDVIGAQQAFTSTLSGVVGNLITLVARRRSRCSRSSWQITLVALVLLPVFLLPARWIGRQLPALTRESMQLNAAMSTDDDRAVQRRRRAAGQAVRPARGRGRDASPAGPAGCATSASRIAMYNRVFFIALTLVASLATALVYGLGGVLTIQGVLSVGTLVALAASAGPPLRAAHRAVERAGRRHDRAGQLRAGLRGARPAAADRRRSPTPGRSPRGPASVEFDHVQFRYPSADEVSLASLEAVAVLESAPTGAGAARRLVPRRARPAGGPGRPVRRRQDHHHQPGLPAVRRRPAARSAGRPRTCATSRWSRCTTRSAW